MGVAAFKVAVAVPLACAESNASVASTPAAETAGWLSSPAFNRQAGQRPSRASVRGAPHCGQEAVSVMAVPIFPDRTVRFYPVLTKNQQKVTPETQKIAAEPDYRGERP